MNLFSKIFSGICFLLFFGCLWFSCTVSQNKADTLLCGADFVLTKDGCVAKSNVCEPSCASHQKCENSKCVNRIDEKKELTCPQPCDVGQYCNNGICVTVSCVQPCKTGEVCSGGVCVKSTSCNPPCPLRGFQCIQGTCEKVCTPDCDANTETCVQGACEKKCPTACSNGSFCRGGQCLVIEDKDKDGYPNDRDCDDNDKDRSPGVTEVCNNKDSNCDGLVDNIEETPCYTGPAGSLGKGACTSGTWICDSKTHNRVCRNEVKPSFEQCDGIDNDCNGLVDDNCTNEPPAEKIAEKTSDASVEKIAEKTPEVSLESVKELVPDGILKD